MPGKDVPRKTNTGEQPLLGQAPIRQSYPTLVNVENRPSPNRAIPRRQSWELLQVQKRVTVAVPQGVCNRNARKTDFSTTE